MTDILKMLKLDLHTFNLRFIIQPLLSYALLACLGSSIGDLGILMIFLVVLIMPSQYQRQNQLIVLYQLLPLSKKTLVNGRCLFHFLYALVIYAVLFLSACVISYRTIGICDIRSALESSSHIFLVFSLVICLQLPSYFSYAYARQALTTRDFGLTLFFAWGIGSILSLLYTTFLPQGVLGSFLLFCLYLATSMFAFYLCSSYIQYYPQLFAEADERAKDPATEELSLL